MAVNWDEDRINAMYRHYQATRDGIPWERYQSIREAAREMTLRAESERHMAEIMQKAREMFPETSGTDVVDLATARRRIKQRGPASTLGGRLKSSLASLQDSFSSTRWVPLAAAAAVVMAVTPLVITQDGPGSDSPFVAQQTEILQDNAGAVSSQLAALGDMQYGFTSAASEFSEAFSAGILFVDLISLSGDPADPQLGRVVDAVMTGMGEKAGISPPDNLDAKALTQIGDRLQAYYSRSSESSVFVFGQWVESTFLLSGVVSESDSGALTDALESAGDIRNLLDTGGFLNPALSKDLDRLESMADAGPLDTAALKRTSGLLLKLRTLYSGF